jgi:adenylosuccinate synthase
MPECVILGLQLIGVPIKWIGVGPGRLEMIERK